MLTVIPPVGGRRQTICQLSPGRCDPNQHVATSPLTITLLNHYMAGRQ
jgi:hypothetical protein